MKRFELLLLALGLAAAVQVRAETAGDVQRLLAAGQLEPALNAVEVALKAKPKDAELRFLYGVVLTDLNRTQEAMASFAELSQEYPELPDPLNNLAVLHAAKGDLDAARTALEAALRNNPRQRELLGEQRFRSRQVSGTLPLAQQLVAPAGKPG
jgi:Flp pilus assembly protein TadD